jgi:hypothetical protein
MRDAPQLGDLCTIVSKGRTFEILAYNQKVSTRKEGRKEGRKEKYISRSSSLLRNLSDNKTSTDHISNRTLKTFPNSSSPPSTASPPASTRTTPTPT